MKSKTEEIEMLPKVRNKEASESKAIGLPTAFKEEYCELGRNYALLGENCLFQR
jgi:hypothetical protein